MHKVLYIPGGCLGYLNHQQHRKANQKGWVEDELFGLVNPIFRLIFQMIVLAVVAAAASIASIKYYYKTID